MLLKRAKQTAGRSKRRPAPSVCDGTKSGEAGGRIEAEESERKVAARAFFQPLDTSWIHFKGLKINNDLTILR